VSVRIVVEVMSAGGPRFKTLENKGMKTSVIALLLTLAPALSGAPGQTASAPQQPPPARTARAAPLGVGEAAPDFTLDDQRGRKVTLSEARAKGPVVLVFYRGYW
jgi:cytochrome oxidase Cu insertion factor (SCO1/SenC/PrrC family)